MSRRARPRANRAGYWNTVNGSPPASATLLPQTENPAPMTGPRRNPQEKAMPITACGGTHVPKYYSVKF